MDQHMNHEANRLADQPTLLQRTSAVFLHRGSMTTGLKSIAGYTRMNPKNNGE